jgi:CheY-like chemotaxis protein
MPKTILIAANDPNIIYLLQRYAEASGFEAVHASQGKELLQLARRVHPELIILEIEMPEVDGKKALHRLKEDPATREIPVVVYSFFDEVICSPEDGAAGYLQKSVLYNDFLAALKVAGVYA